MVSRALLAGLITSFIFLAGLSFGLLWDQLRKDKLQETIDEITVYSSALFIESQLLPQVKCEAMEPLLADALKDISEALDKYTFYTKTARVDIDRQKLLYRRYLLANVRYWMFAKRYREECNASNAIILFFFDENCRECLVMADRLTYLKKKYGDKVLVFPVNMYLAKEDPVAHTLAAIYNVTSYPTIIFEDKKYGVLSKEELEGLVCAEIGC